MANDILEVFTSKYKSESPIVRALEIFEREERLQELLRLRREKKKTRDKQLKS